MRVYSEKGYSDRLDWGMMRVTLTEPGMQCIGWYMDKAVGGPQFDMSIGTLLPPATKIWWRSDSEDIGIACPVFDY